MKKDFKRNIKTGFSTKTAMRKFIDCLNKAEIFNEKIPYLVIHQGEKYYDSKLELKLTFKDNIKDICTSKDKEEVNKQLMNHILNKLNEIPNFQFDIDRFGVIGMIEKTNTGIYKYYAIFTYYKVFNQMHDESKPITNNCTLIVKPVNKYRITFDIYGE